MSWDMARHYWQDITALSAFFTVAVSFLTICWVLTVKKEPTSALAWCLLVLFVPLIGALLFVILGYQNVSWPLSRKRKHKRVFQRSHPPERWPATPGSEAEPEPHAGWEGLDRLAQRFDAFPRTEGNRVRFYYEGEPAFADKLAAILAAKHHIHLEYFIFQPDATGQMFLDALVQKAREGVQVRLLYDAMGSFRLHRWMLRPLRDAGGQFSAFLPLNLLQRRIQVNLRNHRKILVVDGRVAFAGGLNIGDEYLGKNPRFGFWRDTHLRVEGPAVASLQRLFIEDWDFANGEHLRGDAYFPPPVKAVGGDGWPVQVIHSGPDQELKGIREIYFAAIQHARQRLWIASPYYVPDAGLRDALCLAGYLGVDVRLLCQFHPDKWIPYFAARYYWPDILDAGVKVYQYARGMMHSKVVLVDGQWASVGSANLDNRSMHLNFEVNCLIDAPEAVAQLEQAFRNDLKHAIRLERRVYARRPFGGRMIENACRLFSPVL
jgi:cardiolipin synthase